MRFADKRLSGWAKETTETVKALQTVSLPLVRSDDETRIKIETLIEHGQQFAEMFYGIVHKTRSTPAGVVEFRRHWEEWRTAANGIAASHLRLIREHRSPA